MVPARGGARSLEAPVAGIDRHGEETGSIHA
jgi:hypothetical protein